jgi:hypothetical protein
MARSVQYRVLIRRARGVDVEERWFLSWKRGGEKVRSERRARRKVRRQRERPIIVRYWKCQP